jgi:hypothetical protein
MIDNLVNALAKPPFQNSLRPVLRTIVNHNNFFALKRRVVDRFDNLFDCILFVVTRDDN